jgi:predicted nuclease of restriction endonuclease-like (RecB) superfamily
MPAAKGIPNAAKAGLYGRVREILDAARTGIARTVNTTQVMANWLIGREIVEEEQRGKRRAGYGTALLGELAERLRAEFGSGYGVDNLELFRRFYAEYPQLLADMAVPSVDATAANISDAPRRKSGAAQASPPTALFMPAAIEANADTAAWQPGRLNANLSWTHYRRLLRVDRQDARAFYEVEAARNAWSARELERQVASLLFDRLAKSRDKQGLLRLAARGHEVARPIDALKDPLVLEFLNLPESPRLVETELEQALIDNLQHFLLELGTGFAFVARQQRITLDGDHFYIDLVFYHAVLKCFVLVDLKVGKLTHADLGQIQFYVNYYDRERRTEGDNPTVGLVLCPDKNDAVVKYTLGEQQERNIFASRYQLHLPTEQQLQKELRRELRQLLPAPAAKAVTAKKKSREGKR